MSVYNWETVKEVKGTKWQIAQRDTDQKWLMRRQGKKSTDYTMHGVWSTRDAAINEIKRRMEGTLNSSDFLLIWSQNIWLKFPKGSLTRGLYSAVAVCDNNEAGRPASLDKS